MTSQDNPADGRDGPVLVVSAHAGDFVWRAGGGMALAASRGAAVTVLCLTYGERGESARAWRDGMQLTEIKELRRAEAAGAAGVLGASIEFLDAGDYPLRESPDLVDQIVRCFRRTEPAVVLTPVFLFEPHQPEQCEFKPEVLLDITGVFAIKRRAMECLVAQQHMWDYYTDLATRRGVQLRRNAGPNLGLAHNTMAEAYMRVYPQVTDVLQ